MILRSFNSLNICLLLFWLKLGCAVAGQPVVLAGDFNVEPHGYPFFGQRYL